MYSNPHFHHHHRLLLPTGRPDPALQFHGRPTDLRHHPAQEMWRTFAKRASSSPGARRILRRGAGGDSCFVSPRPVSGLLGFAQSGSSCRKGGIFRPRDSGNHGFRDVGFAWDGELLMSFAVFSGYPDAKGPAFLTGCRGLATVAEAVSSSTDVDEEGASSSSSASEIQDFLEQLVKEDVEESGRKCGNLRELQNKDAPRKPPRPPPRHRRKLPGGLSPSRYASLKRRQIKMETEAWEQAAKEYKELLTDMCQQKLAPNLPYMKSLFMGWFEPLRDKIAAEQKICWETGKNKISHAPYFVQLPEDMMAVITMHKLMGLLMTGDGSGSARVVVAALHIGDAVEQEVRIQRFLDSTRKKGGKKEGDETNTVTKEQENLRKKVTELMKKQRLHTVKKIVKAHDDTQPWGQENQVKVGSRLIDLLIQTAYIQPPVSQSGDGTIDIRPAFRHIQKVIVSDHLKHSRRYGVIECDPLVRQGLDKSARHMVIPYTPMLVPPVDWTGYDKGGHFFLPSYIMRTHGAKQQRDAVKRSSREQMQAVYEALNTLGNTKWRVNKIVLSIVDRLWSSGGRLAGLVDREDIPLPVKRDTEDDAEIRKWKWQTKGAKKVNNERHSQRCDVELKLSVARKMKDEEGFYYPHNIDFRGRAYPMHPYLNHLGSDLCRGVLVFAEGRPLGKSGFRWLKIHLANLYAGGVDKLSYDGRIAFTENHVEDIFDSADRPLEGRRWWLGAEDPFQCLAVCINLAEALRSSSPESTISHIPVHQDGSCNGLQHYAALGRDQLGAAAVNLVDGDKPADVYSGIADRVLQIMLEDSEKDPAVFSDARYAKLLIGQVDRKLVKQTVMTSVYGVTYIGAREQIKRRLKERGFAGGGVDDDIFGASCYAAKVTLTALGEMFQAARGIMNWLGDCAKVIAADNHPVCWTTPIGLPVVQPYKAIGRHLVKTSLQILTLQRETDKVMVKRQRTAFPPNFVHSLDGSHMMMTSVACRKAGLNFAGVHDSYWTHACDVDVMNKILREKFVELYQAPVLENLLNSFQKSFPSLSFPPLPDRGDFDLREVINSTYFFN